MCHISHDHNNDKSSDDKKSKNDPCNYDGLNVCNNNGDCDNDHFDCLSYDKDGNECTTGQCPGDDDKVCWKNQEFIGCPSDNRDNHKHDNSDSNSNSNSNGNVKRFKVKVNLDGVFDSHSDTYQIRVIVYGKHTLNKPTLDKPWLNKHVQTEYILRDQRHMTS